jgi:hypothetical protein
LATKKDSYLGLDGVVVVLSALGEDVLDTAGLARVEEAIAVKVVRLEELDPAIKRKLDGGPI